MPSPPTALVALGACGVGACLPARPASARHRRRSSGRFGCRACLAGFGAGAALALAGALMQLLTRNALADLYVLGVAGGASVGALGTCPRRQCRRLALQAAHAGGCRRRLPRRGPLFTLLGRRLAGPTSTAREDSSTALLLVGVMIGSGCSAIVSSSSARRPGPAARRGLAARRPERRCALGDRLGSRWLALVVSGRAHAARLAGTRRLGGDARRAGRLAPAAC